MLQPAILLYHSVVAGPPKHDTFALRVAAENFAAQMQYLKAQRTVLSLSEFTHLFERDRLPKDAVALTFDDGYADNAKIVAPLLKREGLPATFFVCTGLLGLEFWWDRLERLIYTAKDLPSELTLSSKGVPVKVRTALRANCVIALWSILRSEEPKARDVTIDRLADGLEVETINASSVSLAPDHVSILAADLFELGAHTVNHNSLTMLGRKELWWEVSQSKADCELLGCCVVSSFSYPHGEFDQTAQEVLFAAGFELACAVGGTNVRRGDSRFALPRIHIENWSAEEFARRLEEND